MKVIAQDDGSMEWLLTDHIGSVRDAVSADGLVENHTQFDGFGRPTSPNSVASKYAFAGREFDVETGMYYNRARYFSPESGRFISEDPARFAPDDPNLFRYVFNSPVQYVDPTGMYGTNSCTYYETRCEESGGSYYCETAQYFCDDFFLFPKYPDPLPEEDNDYEGWVRCVRKCLQDCDDSANDGEPFCGTEDPDTNSFWDGTNFVCHVKCYTACAAWGVSDFLVPPAY